jgi:hypothetical protein
MPILAALAAALVERAPIHVSDCNASCLVIPMDCASCGRSRFGPSGPFHRLLHVVASAPGWCMGGAKREGGFPNGRPACRR